MFILTTRTSAFHRPFVASTVLALCVLGATPIAQAQAPSRFVGTWVEDQSKRTMGAERRLTFRSSANGSVEELRGSYARPLVQPVRFGVPAYPVDGSRNTIAWKQLGPSQFERVIAQNGVTLNTRRLQVSSDGTVLTETIDTIVGGKTTTVTMTYRRASGDKQGLVGVWTPLSRKADTPATLRVEAVGTGLKLTNNPESAASSAITLTFDGKAAAVDGPAVISGTTANGRRIDESTIQVAQAREGVATGTTTFSLSPDGKTLTSRATTVGPDASKEPSITVYLRQ
jgi:hypothetical protein